MNVRTLVLECRVCGQQSKFVMDDMTTVRTATAEFLEQHRACAEGAPLKVILSGREREGDPVRPIAEATIPQPAFFDCGCSVLKVKLGRCDVYDEHGNPRDGA